jgi:hypothetical protein
MRKMNDRSRFGLKDYNCVIPHSDKFAGVGDKLKGVLHRGPIDQLLRQPLHTLGYNRNLLHFSCIAELRTESTEGHFEKRIFRGGDAMQLHADPITL